MDSGQAKLSEVIERCRQEQSRRRPDDVDSSPSCVELFRRAFQGDGDAWDAIWAQFQGLMLTWARAVEIFEVEDIVQDGFANFARGAPKVQQLVAADQLGPVLKYLRTCLKRAALHDRQKRQVEQLFQTGPFDDEFVAREDVASEIEQRDLLDQVLARVAEISDDDEELVFRCRLVQAMTPRQIYERFPDRFRGMDELYGIIQRLMRRLENDPVIQAQLDRVTPRRQKTFPSRSLEVRMEEVSKEADAMDSSCSLSDAQLLDYITGVAQLDVRAMLERSPACREAARRLARTMLPLSRLVYRADCPSTDRLVAYGEQQLLGTDQLLVRAHVIKCDHCQADLAMLEAIDEVPIQAPPRRLVEASFLPALLQGVRGTVLRFQAPTVIIQLSARKTSGQSLTWNIRGELRTHDGLPLSDALEVAQLQAHHPLTGSSEQAYEAVIEPDGAFSFQQIPPGRYKLSLLTGAEEIVIRELAIDDSI